MKALTLTVILSAATMTSSCVIGAKYSVGGILTGLSGTGLVLEDNAGNDLSLDSNGAFTFRSNLSNKDSYSVTVRTQPSNPAQNCSVQNASGTIDKADVTNVIVVCTQAARFAYVANQLSNDISAYAIDSANGSLAAVVGSPFAVAGTAPVALAVDPNGTYLYAANNGSNSVTAYAIDAVSGVLTVSGFGNATGSGPDAVAIDPTGRFLYVANFSADSVSAFSIATSGGTLTELAGSPFTVGNGPSAVKVSPNGEFLYVTNFDGGNVTVMSIDSATGVLSSIAGSPFGAGNGAVSIAIDPTGTYAYVANETAASISEYALSTTTGIPTLVSGSPLGSGSNPQALAADPLGRFLYAANATINNDIASYSITPTTGALALIGSTGAGALPLSIGVDPAGQYVYIVNDNSNDIIGYSVNATSGVLTPLAQGAVSAGNEPRSIAID